MRQKKYIPRRCLNPNADRSLDLGCGAGDNLSVTFDTFGCHHLGALFNAFQAGHFDNNINQNCLAFTRGKHCGTVLEQQDILDFGDTGGHCSTATGNLDDFFDGIRIFGPCEFGSGGK